jgi:riboflavin biosynthesis pyrimidine reductase
VILRRIYPDSGESTVLDDLASRSQLAELYRPPSATWLRLNFIASVSGNVVGSDGSSEKLSNPVDRRILGVIRELSDVVLIGAGSLRTEGYLRPRNARLAVVTASGDISTAAIAKADAEPLIILCPSSAAARVRESLGGSDSQIHAEIITLPETSGRLSAQDIVGALSELGLASIVCEGGPILARQFVEEGLVDELCLSTSPMLNGASLPIFGVEEFPEKNVTLTQLLVDDASGLYARWAIERSPTK